MSDEISGEPLGGEKRERERRKKEKEKERGRGERKKEERERERERGGGGVNLFCDEFWGVGEENISIDVFSLTPSSICIRASSGIGGIRQTSATRKDVREIFCMLSVSLSFSQHALRIYTTRGRRGKTWRA